jgi:hypothetical protein
MDMVRQRMECNSRNQENELFVPHPEERRLRRVSKDVGPFVASWFETRDALLTMRIV